MIKVGKLGLVSDDNESISVNKTGCEPLLDRSVTDEAVEEMLDTALKELGYSSFRPGQV